MFTILFQSTKTSRFVLFGSKESADLKEQKKKSRLAKNMAKGVGYSSYQQKGWDVKAYMAAQKEKDKQIELVLEKIQQELKRLHGSQQVRFIQMKNSQRDDCIFSITLACFKSNKRSVGAKFQQSHQQL